MAHRSSTLFLILLIVASAAFAVLRFDSLQVGTSYDDAHYIILAESLASGQGYQLINFPRPQIERNFPPGWSLLLAPFTLLFPKNYDALKVVSLVLWLASIGLVYKLFAKRLSSPLLEILTGLVALNPLLIGASVTVMSESAFVFFSLLALVTLDLLQKPIVGQAFSLTQLDGLKTYPTTTYASGQLDITDKQEKNGIGIIALAAVFAFYAQQIRTIGIALPISLLIILLITRRFKDLGIAAMIFLAGFLLQAWINLRNGGTVISSGYEAQVLTGSMLEKLGQVWMNASGYFNEVAAGALIPIFGTRLDSMLASFGLQWIMPLINITILAVIVVGFLVWKPKLEWMHIYFIVYLAGILAFWNPQVGSVKVRFLIPILPMMYFYFLYGLSWLIHKISRQNAQITTRNISASAGIIALVLLTRNIQDWRSPVREQMSDLSIGTSWVAENAPADAIVMVNEPVPAYVHVKRKTIGFPKNDQELEKYLDNQGIDYIVIAPLLQSPPSTELDVTIEEQILPMLVSKPEMYALVFEDGQNNVRVFEYIGKSY